MSDEECRHLLKEQGFEVGESKVRSDRQRLIQINGVFMFPSDGEDLAHGRTTIAEVIRRNAGKVFPDATP